MTPNEARRILQQNKIELDGSDERYANWNEDGTITLDAAFTADELEAIAVLMRAGQEDDVSTKELFIKYRKAALDIIQSDTPINQAQCRISTLAAVQPMDDGAFVEIHLWVPREKIIEQVE